jgi:hypothetical protein
MRWRAVGQLLLGAGVLVYVLSRFIPCTAVNNYPLRVGLDDDWTQILHVAFARHLQFGTELIFTYGPWGFLARGYHPDTYPVSVIAWIFLALVFAAAGWRLARHFSANNLVAGLVVVGFTIAATLPVEDDFNNKAMALALQLFFLRFFVEERAVTPLQILLAAALGWTSLIKFTGLLESAVLLLVIAADDIFRRRRLPWLLVVWLLSLLAFWMAAGQAANSLAEFLINSWRITSGYTEAMMLDDPAAGRGVVRFLLLAGLLCACVGRLAWLRHRTWGALPVTGIGLMLFVAFKLGYVRAGWQHETSAALSLVLLALAALVVARRDGQCLFAAAAGLLLAGLLFATVVFDYWLPGDGLGRQVSGTFRLNSLAAPVAASITGYLPGEHKKNLAHTRKNFPLPQITGGTDLYSFSQSILFANALAYAPRPVVQSYSAYTPALAEMNAAHLRTARAARNILFAPQPIDGRFPSLEDGRSWPELLTRYDCKGPTDDNWQFLLLTRAAVPRTYRLVPLATITTRFGEPVKLPALADGPIWAEIEFQKTFAGKILSTVYKPPVMTLRIALKNGSPPPYRLVPGMAAAGFLLSPLIADNRSFAALAGPNWKTELAGQEVTGLKIFCQPERTPFPCYAPAVVIKLYRLDFSAQEFKPSPPE